MKKSFLYTSVASAIFFAMHANAAEQTEQLDEINVSAGSMFRMGEVPFAQAKSSVAISQDALSQQGLTKLDELGRYQSGFQNQVFGNDTNTNWFRIRGAEATQAIDGKPVVTYGFFTPHANAFGLEAVEVTKGADSLAFGAANAGGLVNYVSKRPHAEQVGKGEIQAQLGNHNQYGVGFDYTGAFNQDNSARYRFVGNYFAKDGEWDLTDNQSLYIAPSFEFDLTPRTRLTILTSYQRDHGTPSSNFLPQDGTLHATEQGKISRSSNLGDPVNDTETNRQFSLGYELEHDFDNGFLVSSSYRYAHVDNYHRGSYAYPAQTLSVSPWTALTFAQAGTYNLNRGVVFNDGKAYSHSLDNHVTYNFKNDDVKNTVVAGFDYRHQKVDARYTLFGSTSSVDVFNTSTGYNQSQDVSAAPHTRIKSRQLGLYLQDNLTIKDTVQLGLGVRHDKVKNDEYTSSQTVKANKTTYSGSVMYLSPIGLNPYYSYTQSFSVPTGIGGDETLYKPALTKQHEVGVKYLPTWLDGTISVAYFQAKDEGALRRNATGATTSGDPVKRRGVEVQAEANVTKNLSALFAYTYLKAETETATGNVRKELLPKHAISAMANYKFTDGVLEGLTLGAGLRYVGSSVTANGSLYSGEKVPSATLVDLMAAYQFNKNWSTQLNIQNIGNRKFIAGCDYYCYYGASRNILANVSYKW